MTGRLSNNSVVHLPGTEDMIGKIVDVKLFGMQRLLLYGGVCVKFWEEAFGFYYMGQRA